MSVDLHARDEGRHAVGAEELWGESWYHDFAAQDGSYGGYLRLGLYPNLGVAWCWIHLVRRDRPLVVVRDQDVPCPTVMRGPIEVGSDRVRGAWSPVQPLRAYRITIQGRGIELADPADAFRDERGPAVPVELDLTWEAAAPCFPYAATTRYEQSAWVGGEVRVGDERTAVRCPGQRDHSWGVRDWWLLPWAWCSGHLDDGTWWHCVRSAAPGAAFQTGYLVDPGATGWRAVGTIDLDYALDGDQLPMSARLGVGDLELRLVPELHAPVLLTSGDGSKVSRLPRVMSAASTPDGRTGRCWLELNLPEGVAHLAS